MTWSRYGDFCCPFANVYCENQDPWQGERQFFWCAVSSPCWRSALALRTTARQSQNRCTHGAGTSQTPRCKIGGWTTFSWERMAPAPATSGWTAASPTCALPFSLPLGAAFLGPGTEVCLSAVRLPDAGVASRMSVGFRRSTARLSRAWATRRSRRTRCRSRRRRRGRGQWRSSRRRAATTGRCL
jgi:hypothetical protein